MALAESRQPARIRPASPTGYCLPAGDWAPVWRWGWAWRCGWSCATSRIRTEADAEAALELPLLVAVPWVVETAPANGNGKGHFWNRKKRPEERKETARV